MGNYMRNFFWGEQGVCHSGQVLGGGIQSVENHSQFYLGCVFCLEKAKKHLYFKHKQISSFVPCSVVLFRRPAIPLLEVEALVVSLYLR